jgi:hypothetical protein
MDVGDGDWVVRTLSIRLCERIYNVLDVNRHSCSGRCNCAFYPSVKPNRIMVEDLQKTDEENTCDGKLSLEIHM